MGLLRNSTTKDSQSDSDEFDNWRLTLVKRNTPEVIRLESIVGCSDAPVLPPVEYALCDVTCAFRAQVSLQSVTPTSCDLSAPGVAVAPNNFIAFSLDEAQFDERFHWLKQFADIGLKNQENPFLFSFVLQRMSWLSGLTFCVEHRINSTSTFKVHAYQEAVKRLEGVSKFWCEKLNMEDSNNQALTLLLDDFKTTLSNDPAE